MVLGGEDFGRGLDHEGEVLMNGNNALKKRFKRDPLPLPPCENSAKEVPDTAREGAPPRTLSCWHLDLGHPVSSPDL